MMDVRLLRVLIEPTVVPVAVSPTEVATAPGEIPLAHRLSSCDGNDGAWVSFVPRAVASALIPRQLADESALLLLPAVLLTAIRKRLCSGSGGGEGSARHFLLADDVIYAHNRGDEQSPLGEELEASCGALVAVGGYSGSTGGILVEVTPALRRTASLSFDLPQRAAQRFHAGALVAVIDDAAELAGNCCLAGAALDPRAVHIATLEDVVVRGFCRWYPRVDEHTQQIYAGRDDEVSRSAAAAHLRDLVALLPLGCATLCGAAEDVPAWCIISSAAKADGGGDDSRVDAVACDGGLRLLRFVVPSTLLAAVTSLSVGQRIPPRFRNRCAAVCDAITAEIVRSCAPLPALAPIFISAAPFDCCGSLQHDGPQLAVARSLCSTPPPLVLPPHIIAIDSTPLLANKKKRK